jgi:hypothetical protein
VIDLVQIIKSFDSTARTGQVDDSQVLFEHVVCTESCQSSLLHIACKISTELTLESEASRRHLDPSTLY